MDMATKEPKLIEVRCSAMHYDKVIHNYKQCNKMIAKVQENTDYQIKCPRCGTMNERGKTNG